MEFLIISMMLDRIKVTLLLLTERFWALGVDEDWVSIIGTHSVEILVM